MKRKIKTVFLLIFLALLLPVLTNCDDATPEQDTIKEVQEEYAEDLGPVDSQEVTEEGFTADGEIGSQEYKSSKELEDFTLYWSIDEEYLYMAMKASTEGYVSIGFDPSEQMKDADMVFGYFKEGQATVLDLYSTGNFGPHPPDEELGGTDDIIEFGGDESNGYTIIEFKRLLVTGDEYDKDISKGTLSVIWAFGNADDLDRSHSKRGSGEIDIE